MFFADFLKGFDLIDHEIHVNELRHLHVHPVLINWIEGFLSNRTQADRIGNTTAE